MKFNASETMKRAEEDFGLGKGQYFKVKEGANKIRLLSPCVPYQSEFKGQTNVKFLCWIIDRVDGQIKHYFMPTTVLNAISGLQMSDDFGFEDVPMPYDITIMAKNAGTKEVEYTVVGARTNTVLTEQEQGEFNNKPSIDEVVEKLREKQSSESVVQQEQPQPGLEKARSVANSLPGANRPATRQIEGNSGPSNEDVNIDDIPF